MYGAVWGSEKVITAFALLPPLEETRLWSYGQERLGDSKRLAAVQAEIRL